jgi:type IV secretion system protein VirB3
MDEEAPVVDTLFLALTRPTLWLGVPVEATLLIATLLVFILMLTGNPLYAFAIGGSLLGASRIIVRTDYNMFRLLFLWAKTKARARNRVLWGGSSYAPLPTKSLKRKGFNRG